MKEADVDLKQDVSKVRSLRGFLDNDKRLSHSLDSDEVKAVLYLHFVLLYSA